MAPVINEEIEVKALSTVEQARAIVVTTVEQRGIAAEMGLSGCRPVQ